MRTVDVLSPTCLGNSLRLYWYGTLLLILHRVRTRASTSLPFRGYLQKSALVLLGFLILSSNVSR
jgi:hypothetical protein